MHTAGSYVKLFSNQTNVTLGEDSILINSWPKWKSTPTRNTLDFHTENGYHYKSIIIFLKKNLFLIGG